MSRHSGLLRRLRQLPRDRREEFLAQIGDVAPGARSSPLSLRQEQLWLFDRVAPSAAAYGLGFRFELAGPLDPDALEKAVGDAVERHVALRTVFPHDSDEGTQIVRPTERFRLPVEEADDLGPEEELRYHASLVRAELDGAIDVDRGPLARFRLLRHSEERHVLLLATHYLVMDPPSVNVLRADLATAYEARVQGREADSGEPAVGPGEFASWQREWLEGSEAEAAVGFWSRTLAGWEPTELPPDLPRPKLLQLTSGTVSRPLPEATAAHVRDLAGELGVSPEDVFLAAYFALVARYTSLSDLIIGLPRDVPVPFPPGALVADRGNLLPIRAEVHPATRFVNLVRSVGEWRTEAEAHAGLPFKAILDGLGIDPDPARLPLVQLGFSTPYGAGDPVTAAGLRIGAERVETGVGAFELELEADWDAAEPRLALRYSTSLYRERTAEQLVDRYLRLLEGACVDPRQPLFSLPFAAPHELDQVTDVWNSPIGAFPDESVPEVFAGVVAEHRHRTAVVWRGGHLTYGEIDAWSDRVARVLVREGVGPEDLVPVLVERGPELIAAVLGVLKAGGAYVPIDLTQPSERVGAIIEDCGASLGLVSEEARHLVGGRVPTVDIGDALAAEPSAAPVRPISPDRLAYAIYTSGSTGRPKAVLVEHRNAVNFIRTVREKFALTPEDRVLQFASPGFDVSVFEIFGSLLSGALLRVVDTEERGSIDALHGILADEGITVIDLPPAIMELLSPEDYPDLRVAFVGGEAFSGALTTRWARGRDFYNGYGPTETTVTVVAKRCEGTWTDSPPIGRAMANHRAYVLDPDLGLLPSGAVGELAVAGLGVARGYLGRPELTAERFRPDPHGPPGSRMYVSGDLASWDQKGDLRFLGRTDRQVKIRGVRIELGEVEAALGAVEGVARAVADVAVDQYRGALLVAYVVARDGADLQLDAVRAELGTRLPSAMIPGVIVPLAEIPLTRSGKTDRRALPEVEFSSVEGVDEGDDGGTPTERTVRSEVFAPLLGRRIGNHTNFFAQGGTSLQAIRISSLVKSVFGVEVPIADFFSAPTVSGLASLVEKALEREHRRRNAVTEALDLIEGRTDEEIAELAGVLDGENGESE
ncbi:non-ribosomal peptide synthetase [Nocardiopsis valliformis]|uniref:non-ribosomal peptide synthetase n=1 Tax=Nocardiopsis valliformis TaxID=239974 RepID=UPI00034C5128|nr:non-ribosomal peptide synthetase [Nocardiopsis valliformis]